MPKSKTYRVVIDTNIWISFIISNKLNILDEFLFQGKIKLVFSEELIEEIKETSKKPKLSKFFKNKNAIEEMLSSFEKYIELIEVESNVDICRDQDDNFLLALSKDANADFLITGDSDLLIHNPFLTTKIITIADFLKVLK